MTKRNIFTTLIYTVLIMLAILFITPIFIVFTNSFMSGYEIINRYTSAVLPGNMQYAIDGVNYVRFALLPDDITFEQFRRLLLDNPVYLNAFLNSVVLAVPIVLGQVLISAPAAYAFEMSTNRHKEKIYFVYIVIMLLPLQVTLVPNFIVAEWMGILGTRASVILPAMLNPFGVFIMRQYMKGLTREYIEAAQLDGASHLRIVFSIVIPLFRPAVAALVILIFVNNWNIVEQAIVFLTPEQIPLSVYLATMAEHNIELIFAASFLYLLPPLILFLCGKKHLVEGIALSGIR